MNIPGKETFPVVLDLVENILLVSDKELVDTLLFVLERMKILVEPSGIAGAAAILNHSSLFQGKKVGVILSGGNMDLDAPKNYL